MLAKTIGSQVLIHKGEKIMVRECSAGQTTTEPETGGAGAGADSDAGAHDTCRSSKATLASRAEFLASRAANLASIEAISEEDIVLD
jgi:hypothetical protein